MKILCEKSSHIFDAKFNCRGFNLNVSSTKAWKLTVQYYTATRTTYSLQKYQIFIPVNEQCIFKTLNLQKSRNHIIIQFEGLKYPKGFVSMRNIHV